MVNEGFVDLIKSYTVKSLHRSEEVVEEAR